MNRAGEWGDGPPLKWVDRAGKKWPTSIVFLLNLLLTWVHTSGASSLIPYVVSWIVSPPPKKPYIHPVSVNVTLFGNKVFADVTELTWGHTGLRWTLIQGTDASIEKKRQREKTTTWRRGRSRRYAATRRWTPGLPEAGTDEEGASVGLWRECGLAGLSTSGSWPPELWEQISFLFSSPRKLTQGILFFFSVFWHLFPGIWEFLFIYLFFNINLF